MEITLLIMEKSWKNHGIVFLNFCGNRECYASDIMSLHRGSYMSAHILLNLLNKLRESDKKQGLLNILSLFCNKFHKFNNSGAGMLDSIYHMTLRLLKSHIFGVLKRQDFAV